MGAKATNTRRGITPTTIQLIHRQRQEDERLWRLPQQRMTIPVWKDNSCLEGTLAGGVLGEALGGALAKKDNWIWSIPAGAVGGALVGCQVDGG